MDLIPRGLFGLSCLLSFACASNNGEEGPRTNVNGDEANTGGTSASTGGSDIGAGGSEIGEGALTSARVAQRLVQGAPTSARVLDLW